MLSLLLFTPLHDAGTGLLTSISIDQGTSDMLVPRVSLNTPLVLFGSYEACYKYFIQVYVC